MRTGWQERKKCTILPFRRNKLCGLSLIHIYFAYTAMTCASDGIFLSWSEESLDGSPLAPSVMVREVLAVFPQAVCRKASAEEAGFYALNEKTALHVFGSAVDRSSSKAQALDVYKRQLLSIVAGMIRPTYGRVLLQGEPVEGISPHIGYMLQRDNLLEWRNIYQNVVLGLEIRKKLTRENAEYANSLLKAYGLWEFRDKYP